ncbi:MAG TPA: BrnA antitoxin family protein [Terriglobales bacterium]|nr:BrnA antitoxin family protein [Terriglobales bacterium]
MKHKKKRVPRNKRKKSVTLRSLRASAETSKRSSPMEEVGSLYRPIKKPVTLRVDADVLAWFKKKGRGYQTRMNRVLRRVMMEERGD